MCIVTVAHVYWCYCYWMFIDFKVLWNKCEITSHPSSSAILVTIYIDLVSSRFTVILSLQKLWERVLRIILMCGNVLTVCILLGSTCVSWKQRCSCKVANLHCQKAQAPSWNHCSFCQCIGPISQCCQGKVGTGCLTRFVSTNSDIVFLSHHRHSQPIINA